MNKRKKVAWHKHRVANQKLRIKQKAAPRPATTATPATKRA
jgi:hypothetical protein